MVGDGDVLECDLFGVLEERVGSPHLTQPGRGQQSVVGRQIIGKSQPIILPHLREENVGRVRLLCTEKKEDISIHFRFDPLSEMWIFSTFAGDRSGRKKREPPDGPHGPYNPQATMINQEHDLARD